MYVVNETGTEITFETETGTTITIPIGEGRLLAEMAVREGEPEVGGPDAGAPDTEGPPLIDPGDFPPPIHILEHPEEAAEALGRIDVKAHGLKEDEPLVFGLRTPGEVLSLEALQPLEQGAVERGKDLIIRVFE